MYPREVKNLAETEEKIVKKVSTTRRSASTKNKETRTSVKPITEKKSSTSKRSTSKKTSVNSSTRKNTTSKESSKKRITQNTDTIKKPEQYEYYDLPYRYNDTTVKILAQTPHALFIYWDISDSDRNNMVKKYGESFFYDTKPILIVHNQTLNTSFEINIDDFTNSWYLKTPTSNCVFTIELARRKINSNSSNINFDDSTDVIHIATSNTIESPNDHVLNNPSNMFMFKNVKTQDVEQRYIKNSYNNIYKTFSNVYNDEFKFDGNPSSDFKIS